MTLNKRCLALLLILIMTVSFCATAETTITHYVPEFEVSVDIPVSIHCVTRESDETNTFFQNPYFDYAETMQTMMDSNIYIYGISLVDMNEFAVLLFDGMDVDLDAANDVELEILCSQFKDIFASQGAVGTESRIYRGKEHPAIRLHYKLKSEEAEQYVLIYYTTHGTKSLMLRFISFYSDISEEQTKLLEDIFESIKWEKRAYSTEPKGSTDGNIYTDYETGLTFMVPTGWNEVKFVAGEEAKKVKYRIGGDDVWVLYESGDMWDTLAQNYGEYFDLFGITRKDIGNDFLSKELVASILGCSESDVSMKTIGDQEYYCMNRTVTNNVGTVSVENQDLLYLCMRESYMYWFQLSGIGISKYEDQFNRFMKTIEYP